jgi:hypothetical protein
MSTKIVTLYSYVSIGAMLAMLFLMWFRIVPRSYYLPFFFAALALMISRVILRLIVRRQQKREQANKVYSDTP